MTNEDQQIWSVCNGEIYNHHELRRQLLAKGHTFRGRCDAEVIPHLYEEYGLSFPSMLRGMFAFAIVDRRRSTIVLGRDRFGIKPIYYASTREPDSSLVFASEIRALLALPGVDDTTDRQSVSDYVALSYIPAPATLYQGIRALCPGEILIGAIDSSRITVAVHRYHSWRVGPELGANPAAAVDRAEGLLSQAVSRQTESDVPIGALLSGGIDSSLVSSYANRAVPGVLKTCNVRFADRSYDETWAASRVSHQLQSEHTVLDLREGGGSWEGVTALLRAAGQPFADTSLFATHAVSKLVATQVGVALSGDGGDEAFGGYSYFWQLARIQRLRRYLPSATWQALPSLLRRIPSSSARHISSRLNDLAGADDVGTVEDLLSCVRPAEHARLCWPDQDLLPVRRHFEPASDIQLPAGVSAIERLSALATEAAVRLTMPNDFLFKVDLASMTESLEVRVPMLDEDLFAFGLTLPHDLKVAGHACKVVLRQLAGRRLPPAIAEKPKQGFAIPMDAWLNRDCKESIRDTLLDRSSPLVDFFRPEIYEPLIRAFCGSASVAGLDREALCRRVILFLSLHLALAGTERS